MNCRCYWQWRALTRRRSGCRSLSFNSLLTFMLSAVAVALQKPTPIPQLPTSNTTPEIRLPSDDDAHHHRPIFLTHTILFCYGAYLISADLNAHDQYRRASRLFRDFGFHSILLTLASLISTIRPPNFWLLPYIPFSVFLVCKFFPLRRLFRIGREVGAFEFLVRRFALARETPPSPGLENVWLLPIEIWKPFFHTHICAILSIVGASWLLFV